MLRTAACLLASALLLGTANADERLIDLAGAAATPDSPVAVTAHLRVTGAVTGEADEAPSPVRRDATVRYVQQPAAPERYARLVTEVAGAPLRTERRLLVARPGDSGAELVAARGNLRRDELNTVQLAADPMTVGAVLPTIPVREGATWVVSQADARRLMRLDDVSLCEVTGILVDTTARHARVRFAGPVHGTAAGAEVKIELRGVALVDRVGDRVSRLNLAWSETRARGPATPALEATAKLNVTIGPADADVIPQESLARVASAPHDTRLETAALAGRWKLLAERDWRVIDDSASATTLRRIGTDGVAAQTTLTPVSRSTGSIEQLERDVRFSLGDALTRVIGHQRAAIDAGAEVLSVASIGQIEGQPTAWRHYLVTGPNSAVAATTTTPITDAGTPDDVAPAAGWIATLRPAVVPQTAAGPSRAAAAAVR